MPRNRIWNQNKNWLNTFDAPSDCMHKAAKIINLNNYNEMYFYQWKVNKTKIILNVNERWFDNLFIEFKILKINKELIEL